MEQGRPVRMAMVTPLPPSLSGIADYSVELLREMGRLVDIDVFYVGQSPDPVPGVRIAGPLHHLVDCSGDYSCIFLQVSNEPSSFEMLEFAKEHPCTVVMHDTNLSGIYGGTYLSQRRFGPFFVEILRQEGITAFLRAVLQFGLFRRCPGPHEYNMNTSILANAKAVIVHSQATASLLASRGRSASLSVVPHGTPFVDSVTDAEICAIREELGIPPDAFLIGAFGALSERKRIGSLLQAIAELQTPADVRCCLVGPASDDWRSRVANMGLDDRVRITGRVDMDTFYKYMAAVDMCVNLRFPWFGEESGPVLRVMASGKPVVVSDVGSFSEIPSDACIKIRTGEHELHDLIEAVSSGIENRAELRESGARAREYCTREHSWSGAATRYLEIARQVSC